MRTLYGAAIVGSELGCDQPDHCRQDADESCEKPSPDEEDRVLEPIDLARDPGVQLADAGAQLADAIVEVVEA
jgi:hypothetical protein